MAPTASRTDETLADVWRSLDASSTATRLSPARTSNAEWAGAGLATVLQTVRQVTVHMNVDSSDMSAVRRVAEAMRVLLLHGDALEIASPVRELFDLRLTSIRDGSLVLDAGRSTLEFTREPAVGQDGQSLTSTVDAGSDSTATEQPDHARLAREIKSSTGLPAALLGRALGVTREQFQRWLAGRPISTVRHGQLAYLHTVAAELDRRLGSNAPLWWRTPAADGVAPAELLTARQIDKVHRRVCSIADPAPIVDGVLVALPVQEALDPADYDDASDGDDSWSPYESEPSYGS